MKQNIQNLLTGQAGILRVASELLLRGMNAAEPFVDTGIDLIVDGRARVQVKTAHLAGPRGKYPRSMYWFKLWQSPIITGATNIRKRGQKSYDGIADFVVFFGVDTNQFWIVPAQEISQRATWILGPRNADSRNDGRVQERARMCEGRWDLIEAFVQSPEEMEKSVSNEPAKVPAEVPYSE